MPILNNKKENKKKHIQLVYCILKNNEVICKLRKLQLTTLGREVYSETTQAEMRVRVNDVVQMDLQMSRR